MDQLPEQGAGAAPAPSLEDRFGAVMDKEFNLPPVGQAAADVPATEPVAEQRPEPVAEISETKSAEPAENEGPEISSLADLAKYNEIELEKMLDLNVSVKVDGKDSTVPLKDVLKSYQLESHVNNKSMEVSNQLKAIEAQKAQFQEQTKQEIQRLQTLGGYANQMIHSKYQNVDWNALRANDPVQYAATWAEFQQDQGNVNAYLNQVQQTIQQEQAKVQKLTQAKLTEEHQALLAARPEWTDAATREKDLKAITSSLRAVGFTPEEIGGIADHRILIAAYKAAQYDALQAKKPEVTQRLRAAPKLVTAGTRTGQAKPNKFADLKGRLKSDPRNQDLASAAFGEYAEATGLLNTP